LPTLGGCEFDDVALGLIDAVRGVFFPAIKPAMPPPMPPLANPLMPAEMCEKMLIESFPFA
jgi:hypothetical protein